MAAVMFRLHSFSPSSTQVIFLRQAPLRSLSSDVSDYSDKKYPRINSQFNNLRRGTGGRSSFNGKVATVFGATGNLGRAVVNQLGKNGTAIIVPYRTDLYNANFLKLCGDLGQIVFTQFNLKDEDSLYKAIKHSNVVVNLIGRDYETPNFTFDDVHVKGAQKIARISKELGVETLLHVSALNVCEKPKPIMLKNGSGFYSSKWRGENVVKEEFPEAIIFRPSDLWGPGDRFINYYMGWFRRTYRAMSIYNKGVGIIKQPVFTSDVARGILKAILDPEAAGHTFQAVGPHRYELSEMMDWWHRITSRTRKKYYYRLDVRYDPTIWARLIFSRIFLARYRTMDLERLERDSTTDIVLPDLPTLEDLDVELTPMEERIFNELQCFRLYGYMDPLLSTYVRPVEPCPLAHD